MKAVQGSGMCLVHWGRDWPEPSGAEFPRRRSEGGEEAGGKGWGVLGTRLCGVVTPRLVAPTAAPGIGRKASRTPAQAGR